MATEQTKEEFSVPQNPEVAPDTKDVTQKTPHTAPTDLNSKRKGFSRSFMSPTDALVSPCTKQLMGNRRPMNAPMRHKLINSMSSKPAPCKSQLADKANDRRVESTDQKPGAELPTVNEEKENVAVP